MKILMVDALVGNDYSICLCSALADVGVNVSLVVPQKRNLSRAVNFPVYYRLPPKGTKLRKIRKIITYFKYANFMIRYSVKNKDAIIHYQFFRRERIDGILYVILKLFGAKLVHTVHNVLPHKRTPIDYLFKFFVYRFSDKLIAHSKFIKNELMDKFNIKQNRIAVIPHGNFDHYLPDKPINSLTARSCLGLDLDDNVILSFGVIRENKGLDFLLKAFEIAAVTDSNLKLVIAGSPQSDKQRKHYEKKIFTNRAGDKIIFHAKFIPPQDVSLYFSAADIVALTYKNIYHSGVIHLAFSFGVPILATNVGDFSEIIIDGKNGYILEKNCIDHLVEKLRGAFIDKNVLRSMGEQARIMSENEYNWSTIGRKTQRLYEAFS